MPPVYAAKYSNVPVWVSTIKDVSVMRRQGDGWVNATHLLKVADFDKPRRTRILERDVQTGEHEKVQGGYGKYQGTWIPASRAMELAQQVGILELVRDLLVYVPQEGVATAELPRQPKPVTTRKTGDPEGNGGSGAQPKRARKINSVPAVSPINVPRAQHMQTMPSNLNTSFTGMPQWPPFSPQTPFTPGPMPSHMPQHLQHQVGVPQMGMPGMPQMQMMPMPGFPMPMVSPYPPQSTPRQPGPESQPVSAASSPSLSSSVLSSGSDGFSDDEGRFPAAGSFHMRHSESAAEPAVAAAAAAKSGASVANGGAAAAPGDNQAQLNGPQQYMAEYSTNLLDFFMSPDKSVIPAALLNPKPGPHINQPIDDEGNTAFHWTCAIGQIEIMRALIDAGADIRAVNNAGHTPLVRAIMFTNNYETRSFSKVLDLLLDTVSHSDSSGRTLLHHIASTASSRTRSSGSRYYTEILLAKLSSAPNLLEKGLAEFVDHQDIHGDTALHIASRYNAQRLSKVLLSYHARANIPNKAGRVAKDMLRAKHAPTAAAVAAGPPLSAPPAEDGEMITSKSEAEAQKSSQLVSNHLRDLARAYDVDLANKDSDIEQVRQLLDQVRTRVSDAEREIPELEAELGPEDFVEADIERLETEALQKSAELRNVIERSQARDLAIIVQKEESDIQEQLQEQLNHQELYDKTNQMNLAIRLRDKQRQRSTLVDEIVVLYGNTGSREKIGKYRQLLATCLEVPEKEVDNLLDGIAQTLETQGS